MGKYWRPIDETNPEEVRKSMATIERGIVAAEMLGLTEEADDCMLRYHYLQTVLKRLEDKDASSNESSAEGAAADGPAG
jgi:hypothetical protein